MAERCHVVTHVHDTWRSVYVYECSHTSMCACVSASVPMCTGVRAKVISALKHTLRILR